MRLQLLALAGCNLIGRSNQQHVTHLALVQALGLQHQIQGLIPRHILQTQSDIAAHSVTGHKIEVGKICDQLQNRTHIDILEIQGQLFPAVGKTLSLALFNIIFSERLDAQRKLVIRLISQVIVKARRLDHYAGLIT